MTTSLVVALALLTAGKDQAGATSEKLAAEIVQAGYKRVGVLPRFIVREPGKEEELGGSIGPQADLYAEDLEDELAAAASDRFKVVEGRLMKKAFKNLTLESLSDKDALRKVADGVGGLDALIVGTVVDGREAQGGAEPGAGGLNVRCRLIDLKDGGLAASTREQVGVSLSDAAYMGESWELRRWTKDGLANVGLDDQAAADGAAVSPFGAGPVYEAAQYPKIRRDRPHPLLDPEFPYPIQITVDDQVRQPVKVGDQLYVTLEPGDVYKIRVKNQCPQRVYLSLFVDGINTLGKQREHPSSSRYWSLDAGAEALFRGWVTGEAGKYHEEEFMIAPADQTVGYQQGFSEKLGIITAVFYTVGTEGVPEAPTMKAAMVSGTFGTGTSGKTRELSLEDKAGARPGIILAAVTIRYVTSSELKQIQNPDVKP